MDPKDDTQKKAPSQFDDTAGFAGYDDLDKDSLVTPRVVLKKLDDAAGFAGYDDES
ncbi:hypothetical protein [Xylanimonas allomyrinae]|uniref:hypothetical protein n=1 Tax=Xylanimonas allomyrinae TaxID=2509459 RepID=UPI0013A6240B|nr:hypothetical protein [Xylanimonas allomyrinae]